MIAVFTPTTRPRESTSGPPEFPGFKAAFGLNHILDHSARLGPQRSPERAYHARGDAGLKAKRIPDGDRELSDANRRRVAKFRMHKIRRIDADDCKIGIRIVADESPRILAPIKKGDADLARAVHNVTVGQNEAVPCNNEARTAALSSNIPPTVSHKLLNLNVYNRRPNPFHRFHYSIRITVEQDVVGRFAGMQAARPAHPLVQDRPRVAGPQLLQCFWYSHRFHFRRHHNRINISHRQLPTFWCYTHLMVPILMIAEKTDFGPSVMNPECDSRKVLERIADKWTALIIHVLSSGTKRHNELRRQISGVSQKMLTQTLRSLEDDGIVSRKIYPVVPPRVEYSLTPLGRSLIEPLEAICRWAEKHLPELEAARAQARKRRSPSTHRQEDQLQAGPSK
jgi:DNA-binding HxlR family transcriptional regulator